LVAPYDIAQNVADTMSALPGDVPAMVMVLQNRYSFPKYPWSVSIEMSPQRCLCLLPCQPGIILWTETFNPIKKYLQKLALATNGIEIDSDGLHIGHSLQY
jgi:hypothetical protein